MREANLYRWPGNSPVGMVDPSGMGPQGGAYILERCPGKQGEEWGCLTRFPRGWLTPHETPSDGSGYTHFIHHTVWAENVQCDCIKFLGLFGERTCSLTFFHRVVVTQYRWGKATGVVKERTRDEERESPKAQCVSLVPRDSASGGGGRGPGGGGGGGGRGRGGQGNLPHGCQRFLDIIAGRRRDTHLDADIEDCCRALTDPVRPPIGPGWPYFVPGVGSIPYQKCLDKLHDIAG